MRISFHQLAVFEGAGLAFVGVADEIARSDVSRDEAPLRARWESGAAAAAQARRLDDVDDLVWRHRECLLQGFIAAAPPVAVEARAVRHVEPLGDDLRLLQR